MRPRGRRVILGAAILLVLALVVAAGIGSVSIAPGEVVKIILARLPGLTIAPSWAETDATIIWSIRLPRVIMAMLVGMGLSMAGGAYQALFQNPLADPYVLGVSAGAAVGGASAIAFFDKVLRLPLAGPWKVAPVPFLAFLGGLAAVMLVYRLAAVGGRVPATGLLLAGVAVSSLLSAVVSLILFFTTSQARDAILFWMMGGLSGANWWKVAWLLPYLGAGMACLVYYGRELNALLLGEEPAQSLGVDVEVLKRTVLAAGALLTAAAVAFAGMIGFVGLVVPHLVRMLVGPDHRSLLPASALVGAVVLVAADTGARSLLGATEIPVGLVMALLGGPFFLWLLRKKLAPR